MLPVVRQSIRRDDRKLMKIALDAMGGDLVLMSLCLQQQHSFRLVMPPFCWWRSARSNLNGTIQYRQTSCCTS